MNALWRSIRKRLEFIFVGGRKAPTIVDTKLESSIRYDGFTTNHADFLTWPDQLIYAIRLRVSLAVVVVGWLPVAVAVLIAFPFGFVGPVLRAPAVYLGGVGFALVVGVVHWGSVRAHRTYEELRPIFTVPDGLYRQILRRWFRIMSSTRRSILFVSVLLLVSLMYIALVPLAVNGRAERDVALPATNLLTAEWYMERYDIPVKVILFCYGVVVLLALGTAFRILAINVLFLLRLGSLPVIPMPALVRARLRSLVSLHVGTSVAWTFGVGLFGVLFYRRYNAFSLSIIILLFSLGALTFAVPQIISRKYVNKSHERLCALVLARLYEEVGVTLREQEQPDTAMIALLPRGLAELAQLTERPKTWVYDAQDMVFWLSGQAIAVVAVFAR